MSFARLHKTVSYLIAGLGLVALCIGPEVELPSEIVLGLAFCGSFFAEGALVRSRSWARAWTAGVVLFLALQVGRGLLGAPLLPLVLELAAALQISRLYNRRGAREHQQIAALALLHLIAATVVSTELAYAFAFLGFVVVTPWMLALSHLRAEIEAQVGEAEDTLERVLASRRVVGPRFLAGTAALALPLFAMTGVVFVAFPRVGLGFLSFGRDSDQRVAGFGANVELGDFGVIRTDPTVVLRVTPPGLPADPPDRAAIRMRGTAFDHYDGRRWTRSRRLRARNVGRIGTAYPTPRRMPRPSRDRPWAVVLDALDEPVIFLPPGAVGLQMAPRVTGGIDVGREILHTPDIDDVRYGDADGLGLRYTAWSSDDPRDHPATELDADQLRLYLQIPPHHARVSALARRWTAGAADDAERVRRLLHALRDSGEYTYSLRTPRLGRRIPLEVFLFESKAAHCEYFATAFAVLARSVGVPSRNVTGFLGGQLNSYGGYYALRQGDAHSWVEVWLPDRGWVTVDPTPASRDDVAPDTGWLRGLRDFADAMRTRWSEHVVGYDLRRQATLFRSLRRWLGMVPSSPPEPERQGSRRESASSTTAWLWLLLAVAAVAAGAFVLLLRRRRRPARISEDEGAREAVSLYRTLDAVLARLGHARPATRTPREHLAHLEAARFGELALVREVTERYLDARFGGARMRGEDLGRLAAAVAALRRRRDLFVPAS